MLEALQDALKRGLRDWTYKMAGPDQAVGQLDAAIRAGAFGVAVFNYRTMFGTAQPAAANARTAGSATPPASAAPDPRAMRQRISAWLAAHGR